MYEWLYCNFHIWILLCIFVTVIPTFDNVLNLNSPSFVFVVLLQGVTIVKPIVFGNVARYFGKKREEDGHTHQWSVYVKPYRNEVRPAVKRLNLTSLWVHFLLYNK